MRDNPSRHLIGHTWNPDNFRGKSGATMSPISLLFIVLLMVFTPTARLQTPSPEQLRPDTPVEREIKAGETHSFPLDCAAAEYVRAAVSQKEITGLEITVLDPEGKPVAETGIFLQSVEPVLFVAPAAGTYRIEIRLRQSDKAVGKYEIKLVERRPADDRDRMRVKAERAYSQAWRLRMRLTRANALAAVEKFNEALPLWVALGDQDRQASTLYNLGAMNDLLGEKQKALDYYRQALPLMVALGNHDAQAQTVNNIGAIFVALGESRQALDHLDQALAIRVRLDDRTGQAQTLNNLAIVHANLGEPQKALDRYKRALSLWTEGGDRVGRLTTLNNIASTLVVLGDFGSALKYCNQALSLVSPDDSPVGHILTLNNLGLIHLKLERLDQAARCWEEALALAERSEDRQWRAVLLGNLGRLHVKRGEPKKALDCFEQALPLLAAVGDRPRQAITLNNVGVTFTELNEPRKAFDALDKALSIATEIGDRGTQAIVLLSRAKWYRDRKEYSQARIEIERSIELIEFMRSNIGDEELRAGYFSTVRPFYEVYIDLLMKMHGDDPKGGFDREALGLGERARARCLLELLLNAKADIRPDALPDTVAHERALRQLVGDKAARLTMLKTRNVRADLIAGAEKELDGLTDEFRTLQTQIRLTDRRYAALTQPEALDAAGIQRLLDSDTVLLEYLIGNDRSWLWLVTPESVESFELPRQAIVKKAVRQFLETLKITPGAARNLVRLQEPPAPRANEDTASALSRMLLGPVAGRLGKKRLIVVPDGVLHYLPFSALPIPSETETTKTRHRPDFLIERHEIVYLPSVSVLALQREQPNHPTESPKLIAMLADPVFGGPDDRRIRPSSNASAVESRHPIDVREEQILNRLVGNEDGASERSKTTFIPRLLGTRREAERILNLVDASKSFRALGFDADRNTVLDADLSDFKYIHFATHGLIDAERPELSSIVLSLVDKNGKPRNGFLRAMEVYNLNLPAELVTLSACETGLGKEIKGEGMVGLTRGFFYAGAKRLVVSLWSVADTSTSELMTAFYGHMLKENMRPAAALRAAQLEMLKNPKRRDPFYWAAFVLQGEYR